MEGLDVCLTPDGPRGPRYKIQPGFIKLAEATGAPIVPIHVRFSSAWRLKTWDRFVIPKPFSRVEVIFDQAITLPATAAENQPTVPAPLPAGPVGFDGWLLRVEQPHPQRARSDRGLELGGRALGDHLAVVDHRDPFGQLVGLVEVLRAEQDGGALGLERADDCPNLVA